MKKKAQKNEKKCIKNRQKSWNEKLKKYAKSHK